MNSVKLPSGMVVSFRKMKVRELKLLADRERVASGEALDDILAACATIENFGPYKPESFKWGELLLGDQVAAFIKLRTTTHGDNFDFDLPCSTVKCGATIRWTLPLSALPVRPYPQASLDAFAEGRALETMYGDKKITFDLSSSKSVRQVVKSMGELEEAEQIAAGLIARIKSFEGMSDTADHDELVEWIEDQDLDQLTKLSETLEAADGGVETTIVVRCKKCGGMHKVQLPLDLQRFWMGKKP